MATERVLSKAYARRLAIGAALGRSVSQSRGHGRAGEEPIRPVTPKIDDRFETALKSYRKTGDQAASAKAVKLSPERFRKFLRENVQIEGRGRTLKITDTRIREMPVVSGGKVAMMRLRGFDQSSFNGSYLNAVKEFLETNETDVLAPFVGQSVIDARGVSHPLEIRPNTLRRLAQAGDELFPEIYRLIQKD